MAAPKITIETYLSDGGDSHDPGTYGYRVSRLGDTWAGGGYPSRPRAYREACRLRSLIAMQMGGDPDADVIEWADKARNVAQQIVDNVPPDGQGPTMTAQQAAFQLRVIRDMAEQLLASFPPK